jgi:hypothetical protein
MIVFILITLVEGVNAADLMMENDIYFYRRYSQQMNHLYRRLLPNECKRLMRESLPWTVYGTIGLDRDKLGTFVDRNRQYWAEFMEPVADSQGKLMVDLRTDTLEWIQIICTLANYIAREQNLKPIYLVNEVSQKKRKVLQSYCPGDMVTVGHKTLRFQLPHALTNQPAKIGTALEKFAAAARSIDSIPELLSWEEDGMLLGDLVYNSVKRRTREGSYDQMNTRLYAELFFAYLLYEQWQPLFEDHDIRAVTNFHPQYLWPGLFGRMALADGCDRYVIWGSKGVCRRYSSLDEAGDYWSDLTPDLFEQILEHNRDQAIERANELLTNRFGISPDAVTVGDTVRTERRTPSLLEVFSLPETQPTVLILPKIFIERLTWEPLFQDHLTWFRELIRHARDYDEINWLVKPHPNRDVYEMKQSVADEVATLTADKETTIRVLPDETRRADIIDAVDAVTTVDGTGGIEYSSYGIPAIMAGACGYTKFGFTRNADTKAEYLDNLTDIEMLQPLSERDRTRAKIACYLKLDLLKNNFRQYDDDRSTYENALSYLDYDSPTDDPLYRKVKAFITEPNRHLFPIDEVFQSVPTPE